MVKERKGASNKRLEGQENWKAAQKKPSRAVEEAGGPTQSYESLTDVQINRGQQDGTSASGKGSRPAPRCSADLFLVLSFRARTVQALKRDVSAP